MAVIATVRHISNPWLRVPEQVPGQVPLVRARAGVMKFALETPI